MKYLRTVCHSAHKTTYKLHVYLETKTAEYKIYIFESESTVGDIYTCSLDIVTDEKKLTGADFVEKLINIAKSDIDASKPQR